MQYLTGIAGFRRLELSVGPGVLIPRPETEVVVERALGRLPRGGVAVDVGTGSGALALALADERPDATLVATESSEDALRWARKNAAALRLDVEFVHCDLLDGLPEALRGKIDVIASNPPYVATSERDALPIDVVEHEPHEALFAGDGGLDVIERLVPASFRSLRSDGWLVLEIAPHQAERVRALLTDERFVDATVYTDLTGRPRVAEGRRP